MIKLFKSLEFSGLLILGLFLSACGDDKNSFVPTSTPPPPSNSGTQSDPGSDPGPAPAPIVSLLNIDFGPGSSSPKIGGALEGGSVRDFWNLLSHDGAVSPVSNGGQIIPHPRDAAGKASNVQIQLSIQPGAPSTLVIVGAGSNGREAFDPMFASYLYPRGLFSTAPDATSTMKLQIKNLSAGVYEFLI